MSARRLLQLLLVLQAGAAAGIAWLAVRAGVALPLACVAGIGAVLLARLALTANNFVHSARHASATPAEFRLTARGYAQLFGAEFAATMLCTSWAMARARPRQHLYNNAQTPVLLLHGYGANGGYWAQLAARLDAAQISHATLDLEPLMAGIDDYAPAVAAALEALCAASGAAQAAIVAHSMGGLVARAMLRAYGRARVARVITLGTPHHGASLAALGVGRNAAQMRPGSAWLAALAGSEDAATRALFTSIYTHHDNIVAPQTSSALAGARNLAFGGIGHVALGRDARILACVMDELANTGAG